MYQREGRIPDALAALEKAAKHQEPAAPWVINWLTGQINASNGLLEPAIASFELVLNTRVPERKFDFGLDYRVLDELGFAYYALARTELPVTSPAHAENLRKAIETYRRTLAIDSEDVSAHDGLGKCYGDPAWAGGATAASDEGDARAPAPASSQPVDPDSLLQLVTAIAGPRATPDAQRDRARELTRNVRRFIDGPRPRYQSRLEPLHDLAETLGPVWWAESDPEARAALARTLETVHRQLFKLLKPDETAEGRAFALARGMDRAANHNAQSIVIHSMHRVGAPGIDPPAAATAADADSSARPGLRAVATEMTSAAAPLLGGEK